MLLRTQFQQHSRPKVTGTAVSELFLSASDRRTSPKFRPNRPAAVGCVNFPMNLHNWSKKFRPSGSRRHLGRNFRRQFGRNFCDSVASLPLLSFSSLFFYFFVSSFFFFFFLFSAQVLEQRQQRTAAEWRELLERQHP